MAKLESGYLGGFSGKLGPAVGMNWKGRAVVRAYQKYKKDAKSPSQMKIRARFAVIQTVSRDVRYALRVGLAKYAEDMSFTNYNAFFRCNYMNFEAPDGNPENVVVNYKNLDFTGMGILPGVVFGGVGQQQNTNEFKIPWDPQLVSTYTSERDKVFVLAYAPEKHQCVVSEPALRCDSILSIRLPRLWDGTTAHFYGFTIGGEMGVNYGQTSKTSFILTLNIAIQG